MLFKESHTEYQQRSLHLVHRIQSQLETLEESINSDIGYEQMILQSTAIEKAMGNFIVHLFEGYINYHTHPLLENDLLGQDVDAVLEDVKRIVELVRRG
jgi:DNA-binding FrmR family transcriptional regulator